MIKNRRSLEELTIIRAIAILLIIIGHLWIYTKLGEYTQIYYQCSIYILSIGLCSFFFISGFLLYYNYNSIQSIQNCLNFYYKRLKRIYPLYWLALLCLIPLILYTNLGVVTNGSTIGTTTYIAMFLGIQSLLVAKIDLTHFWFVSVIILYYLLFPIFIYPRKLINMLSLSIFIFLIAYIIKIKFNIIDIRFFIYYWAFIIGIIVCWIKYNRNQFSKSYKDYLILLISLPLLAIVLSKNGYFVYYMSISVVICLILYYLLNSLFENKALNKKLTSNKIYGIFSAISISSYANYLFHPTILLGVTLIFNYYNLNPWYHNLIMIFVMIPLIFVMSYYLQLLETKFVNNIVIFPRIRSKIKKMIFSP